MTPRVCPSPAGRTVRVRAARRAKVTTFALPAPYNKRRVGCREADTLRAVLSVLNARGIWHRRIEVQGVMTHLSGRESFLRPSRMQGLPDVIAVVGGQLWGIEVKASGGRVAAVQAGTLREISAAGGVGVIVVDASALALVLQAPERLASLSLCQGVPVA
jgi:hypothetical protein